MKTVFITGSGKRLGKELAMRFAGSGWNIGLHYFSSEAEAIETYSSIKKIADRVSLVKSDVRDYDEFRASVVASSKEIGFPDVFINNAGIFPKRRALSEISPEEWNNVLATNLTGTFYAAKIYSELMNDCGCKSGRIINIASLGGVEIWKGRIPYNVSKAGVITLTKTLARELAPNISVNAVCPGTIVMDEAAKEREIDLSKIPMGRYGSPDDIFSAVRYFAECPMFITGQILMVDGGNHLIK